MQLLWISRRHNNKVDRKALWSVLKIYGVGGQLQMKIQAFYREANACVRVDEEFIAAFQLSDISFFFHARSSINSIHSTTASPHT